MADAKTLRMAEVLLPEDLWSRLFAKLRLRDRVRSRAVCKLWNTLLSSQIPLHEQEEEPPWVCIHRSDGKTTVWCPGSKETFDTSPNALLRPPDWTPNSCFTSLLASSHGLVLGLCKDSNSWVSPYRRHIMVLGHPFSGKWIKLPPFRGLGVQCASDLSDVLSPSHASMVVEPLDGSYKVNVLVTKYPNRGDSSEVHLSLFFDSSMGSFVWVTPEPFADPSVTCSTLPEGSLLTLAMMSWIRVHDVQTGRCIRSLSLKHGSSLSIFFYRHYVRTNDDYYSLRKISFYRLGNYKGRCILIHALSEQWGYEVLELERDATTEQMTWSVLSTFRHAICSSFGNYRPWFMFEGDYLVAFAEKAVVAFNLDKLTWHCYRLPPGLCIEYKKSCVFTPSLTSFLGPENEDRKDVQV